MSILNLIYVFLFIFGIGAGCSQSLLSVGAAALAFFSLMAILKNSSEIKSDPLRLTAVALLAAWMALHLGRSFDFSDPHSADTWKEVPLFLLLLLPFGQLHFERNHLKKIIIASIVALHVATFYSLYQTGMGAKNATGFFKNPIYYAYSLFPAFLFCSEYFFRFKRPQELFFNRMLLSGALSSLVGILLSNNRMTFLLASLYLILRGIYFYRNKVDKKILASAVFFALCSFIILSQRPLMIKKFELLFEGKDRSTESRMILWEENFKMIREHPILGLGYERNAIDTATEEMSHYSDRWKPGHDIFSHNIFIQTLAESGVVGFLFFYGFWLALALCFPNLRVLLACVAVSGLSENIFNNSRACLPLLFYTLLGSLILKSETDTK